MIISHHHSSSIIIHHPPLSVFVNHHYSVLSTTHCSPISASTTLFDCLVIIHHQTSTCHNPWTFSFIQNPSEVQITNHFQTSHNAFQRRIYIKSYEIKKRSGLFTDVYSKLQKNVHMLSIKLFSTSCRPAARAAGTGACFAEILSLERCKRMLIF